MPVIGHQAPSENLGLIALDGLFQNAFESFVVAILLEDGHAGIAAIEHMVNQATISRTFRSSHAPKVTNPSPKIKKRFLTPFPRPCGHCRD
jgi:hypothetical protein